MSHLEEIKLKLSIEEVVGSYVQLTKAGRNLKALCPFHNDSRPSMMVSPEKGIAYCFACNTGGDIFKFTQLIEKVEFPEAVKILAQRANVRLPEYNPKLQDAREKTIALNDLALRFFKEQLKQDPQHQTYFLERGLTPETLEQFQLGYSLDSYQALKNELMGKGYQEVELVEAGLTVQRSIADKSSYDKFRHRLMFPLFNLQGQTVGFAGRVLDGSEPKYLNSPDTPAYQKSQVVYALNWAKEAIKEKDLAIVMEGYMDVITAHQAGTKNAVATSGTALTPQQLKLLKRYTNRLAFAFDKDQAGMQATERAISLAQELGFHLSIIQIPEGKDPDECIRKNPEAWQRAIENRLPVMDFYFEYAFELHPEDTLENRKMVSGILLPLIKQLPSTMEQGHYLEKLASRLKTNINWLWHDLDHFQAKKSFSPAIKNEETKLKNNQEFSQEIFLIGFMVQYPQTFLYLSENLIRDIGLNEELEKFYKTYENVYNRLGLVELKQVKSELSPEEQTKLEIYGLLIETHYPDFSPEAGANEVKRLVQQINRKNFQKLQNEYVFRLKNSKNQDEKNDLLQKYHQILALRAKL